MVVDEVLKAVCRCARIFPNSNSSFGFSRKFSIALKSGSTSLLLEGASINNVIHFSLVTDALVKYVIEGCVLTSLCHIRNKVARGMNPSLFCLNSNARNKGITLTPVVVDEVLNIV